MIENPVTMRIFGVMKLTDDGSKYLKRVQRITHSKCRVWKNKTRDRQSHTTLACSGVPKPAFAQILLTIENGICIMKAKVF